MEDQDIDLQKHVAMNCPTLFGCLVGKIERGRTFSAEVARILHKSYRELTPEILTEYEAELSKPKSTKRRSKEA